MTRRFFPLPAFLALWLAASAGGCWTMSVSDTADAPRPDATLGERYEVSVYFSPDTHSPRLRRGQQTFLDSKYLNDAEFQREKVQVLAALGVQAVALHPYVQVSSADHPFAAPLLPPDLAFVPFDSPEAVGDSDLIGMVDAARAALVRHGESDQDPPVVRIEVRGDKVKVYFGWQVGMLYGRGSYVTLRKKIGHYTAEDATGIWVS